MANALRLIVMLTTSEYVRVSAAARELAVTASTAHRLLRVLTEHGFATQDTATRAYGPGPALVGIGLAMVRDMDIRAVAADEMAKLSRSTGETVHLLTLEGTEVLFIYGVEGHRSVRVGLRVGIRMAAYTVSGGKAILASLAPDRVRQLYPGRHLAAVTPKSHRSRRSLERELTDIRSRGYAVSVGESESDVCALGVAIMDSRGEPVAALTISIPASRFVTGHAEGIAPLLIESAKRIGALL